MRLTEIDPSAFARELVERVRDHHVTRLIFDVDQSADVRLHGLGGNLELAAHLLAHYARTGEPPGDAPVSEYLQTYCEALYMRPADSGTYDVPPLDQVRGEPAAAHEVVLVAAVARDMLEQGEPVSLLHLAVLSGASEAPVSYQHVRRLAAAGEIRTSGEKGPAVRSVSAAEARRWLGARGVPGYR